MATGIPSPPGHGMLGHQGEYAADPIGSFRRWTAVYGDAIRLRFGPVPVLLLTSPEAVEDVLVREEATFRKAPVIRRLAARVIGRSLFTSEGEAWRRQRALLEGFFTRSRIQAHVPLIGQEVRAMVDRWRPGQTIAALAETMRLSQRIDDQSETERAPLGQVLSHVFSDCGCGASHSPIVSPAR